MTDRIFCIPNATNHRLLILSRLSAFILLIVLAMCMLMHHGLAQTTFTSNGNGDWDNPATWDETGDDDPDDIPDANDIVIISATHTVSMTTAGTFDVLDLTISGTLDFPSNNRTLNVGGDLVMSGTSAITGNNNNRILNVTGTFTVSSGTTATINGQRITITGTTTLDGTLAFASTTGDKTFGTIDVNASGHWNNNSAEDFVITGNIINDGTWTGCSNQGCLYEFTSTTGTISGSATVSVPDILMNSPASITNNGTLLLTDDFTGTGTFTNGATGDFQISGNNNLTLSTFDFTTVGNTVTYTGGSNTTILTETFHDLVVAKGGNRAQVGSTITVNNDLTVSSGEFRIIASGTANISGNLLVIGGEFSPNDATGVVNVTGDLSMSSGTYDQNNGDVNVTGDLIISGGTMTMNGTGSTVDVDDFTLSTGTVTLTQGALNVNNATGGLTVNSGSLTIANAAHTLTVAGTYQVSGGTNDLNNGTLNVVTLTIDNSQTLLMGSATVAVTGTTTANGTITVDGTGGTKTFQDLTISGTGNWNVAAAESFTINGNIINNGTWTGCSNTNCVYTLTNGSGSLSGSTTTILATLTIDSPGSYSNTGNVQITNDLLGTGGFTNANGSTLELNGAGPFSITTLDASTNANTVTYSGGSAVTVNGATYHNLTINKSGGSATILSATTVNNDLTVTSSILAVGAATLAVTNDLIIDGGEFTPGDASSVVNVSGNISMSSGLYDQNDGDVNVTGDFIVTGGTMTLDQTTTATIDVDDFSVSTGTATLNSGTMNVNNATGGLTVNSGALTLAGATLNVTSDYTVAGGTNDLNGGALNTTDLVVNNSQTILLGDADLTVSGTTTANGTITTDDTGGTKTFNNLTVSATGNWNVTAQESFTVNGNIVSNGTWTGCANTTACTYNLTNSSGTITGSTDVTFADVNIDAPASYTNSQDVVITDDLTGTGTFTNANGSTLEFSGDGPLSITTFNASANTNTVTFSGGSSISVNPGDYYNLVFNKSGGTASIGGTTNVLNNLSLTNVGIVAMGAATLTVTNDLTIDGPEFSPENASAVVNVGGNLSLTSGLYDHNDGDVNVTGDFIVTGGTMTLDQTTTATIDVDDFSVSTGTATLNSGTMNVNNATGGLTVNSGALTLAGATLNVANHYTVAGGTNDLNGGALNTTDLVVNNSQTILLGDADVTVSGTTTANGTITTDDTGGTKTFNNLTVSATGNWNVTAQESFTINGNIVSNGTWTGCANTTACTYNLTNSSGTITGSTDVTFADVNIDAPGSYTNSQDVIITDDLTGTGTFTNAIGSTLEFSGDGPLSITTFNASANTNTVTFSGGSNVSVNPGNYYNLVFNKSGNTATISGTTNVLNNMSLTNSGVVAMGAATLTVTNNLTIDGPEFTPNDAAAVANVGGNLSLSSGLYDHNDGDVNITGDFLVTGGTMTLNQGTTSTIDADDFSIATGSVTLSSGTMNVTNASGGLTVTSGSLTLGGATLAVTNLYNLDGGTNDFNSGTFSAASLDIAGSQELTVGNLTYTITGVSEINGTMTFDNNSGTKNLGDVNVNSGGVWSNNTNADFTISGSIVSNGASWTGCAGSGCDYTLTSSSGAISGSTALDMSDLIINSPASYTSTADLSVNDRITGTGTLVNGANASLTYSGNNSSGANFDITNFTASATGNTVTYGRAGDQQLRTTTDVDNNYYNVVINSTAAGNDLNLAGNITIDNQLTLTVGDVILGTNRLSLADGATLSGGSADSYIAINDTGVLRQNYSAAGATLAFPIGDAGDYSPITALTINTATFGASPYLEFSVTDANHPNRNTSNTPTGDDDGTAAVDYISRYWTVTANNITSPSYNTDYVYVDADIVGTESNMVGTLYRIQPTLGILDWFVTGTVNPSNNTVSLTNADAFGDLYAMDNTLSRLPIVLVSFEAREEAGRVVLNWVTASEENNAFFTIERSVNGKDFEDVLMRDGAGNSETFIHYEATDVNPPAGRVFYRLKQTDFNGTFEYSDLVSVDVPGPEEEPLTFAIMGNLVSPGDELKLNRSQAGEAMILLQSVDGRKSITYEIDAQTEAGFTLQLPVLFTRGMYVLQLVQNGQELSQKLIIQ